MRSRHAALKSAGLSPWQGSSRRSLGLLIEKYTDVMPLDDVLKRLKHLPPRNAQGPPSTVTGLAWVRWTILLVSGRLSHA